MRKYLEQSAIFSPCGKYRYLLGRRWKPGPTAFFCGLNPSKAGVDEDDPTVRKCVGFADRFGAGALVLANMAALVSTEPRGLLSALDPIGPDNDRHLVQAARTADRVIVAWGALDKPWLRERARKVLELLADVDVYALAVTRDGFPAHPSRLPYVDAPVLVRRRAEGPAGLDDLETLCVPCHKRETRELARRRARERRGVRCPT